MNEFISQSTNVFSNSALVLASIIVPNTGYNCNWISAESKVILSVGLDVGNRDGTKEGITVETTLGLVEEISLSTTVGKEVKSLDGDTVGLPMGSMEGLKDDILVGESLG